MMKVIGVITSVCLLITITACTSVEVNPVPADSSIGTVKIVSNPKVKVTDFTEVMQEALSDRGIKSQIVEATYAPKEGEYFITYSARRSWDFSPYLSDAYVNVHKNSLIIGKGKYHHNGGSCSLSFYKWQGTRKKMMPVYNELFKNFPERTGAKKEE